MTGRASLQEAADFAVAHETPWDRGDGGNNNWGIHNADRPPWNKLLGPVYPRGPVSGVVRVAGRELIAWGEPDRADLTFSVAKTCLALLAGVAHDTGLLPDLDEAVSAKVRGAGFDTAHNKAVTWLHLLQQTSEWEGECFGVPDQVDRYRHLQYQPARIQRTYGNGSNNGGKNSKGDARPLQAPGSYWEYNDVRINALSLALLHVFRRPLPEVFRDTIMQPIGASDAWRWEGYANSWVEIAGARMQSVPGGTHWGGGMSIGSRDQALIGQLLLDEGRVNGRQVLSKEWINRMQTPCVIAPWYGTLVWLNRLGGVFPSASKASVFAIGAGASVVWIDPERDMVAVVRWIEGSHIDGFCQRVAAAVPPRRKA